jgi:hypothetical protein
MSAKTPLSDRVCDAAVLVFAVWTIVCNCCVALEATLHELLGATLVVAIAAILWTVLWPVIIRIFWPVRTEQPTAEAIAGRADDHRNEKTWQVLVPAIGSTALAIGLMHAGRGKIAWAIMVAHFVVLAVARLRHGSCLLSEGHGRSHEAVTWALAAACAVFTLFVHRPDPDDCFYVNASVGVVDNPNQPLLKWDTMHGVPGTPILLPAYRVHSIELLTAALSWVTGIEAIDVCHLLLPAVGAIFCCLAWARLLRTLLPSGWIWVLLVVVWIQFFVGGPHRWFSNFALVRLQQGKSLLVTAGVPLLIAYAALYVGRPSMKSWVRLAAIQIAAVGFSSTAIWLAPTVVGLAALSTISLPLRPRWKTLLWVAASSAYVLAVGLAVAAAMRGHPELPGLHAVPKNPLFSAFHIVFRDGLLRDSCLAALLLGWYCCPTALLERLCILYVLGVLLTVLNPWLAQPLAANVIGGPTYWRTLWVLPLPMFIAIVVAAPMTLWGGARRGILGPLGYAAALLALAMIVAPHPTFSERNGGAQIRWPGRKVGPDYTVAARIVRLSPPGSRVLAPSNVATWIPTFHRHPYPLLTRELYAFVLDATRPGEGRRRLALEAYVRGTARTHDASVWFAEALRDRDLQLVCVQRNSPWFAETQTALRSASFVSVDGDPQYEIWVRNRPMPE